MEPSPSILQKVRSELHTYLSKPEVKNFWKDKSMNTFAVGLALSAVFVIFTVVTSAPEDFNTHTRITIEEGSSLREISMVLKEHKIVRFPLLFQVAVHLYDREDALQAGVYTFPQRFSVFKIARALTTGDYQVPPYRVTIFEGMRVEEIAKILEHENDIDYDHFVEIAKPHEGYLFPETYYIPDAYTAEDILLLMTDTFNQKIADLKDKIEASPLTPEEIVVFASILEREARSKESMRTVAGILFNRLNRNMPLQVDATFEYYLDKSSADLTLDDLATDSPYNTYKNLGLPPTPIANPGLQSIEAVLDPIETDYLFYLTAPGGVFHYSRTFEEHKRNKELYL